jgi:hypothetical protein
LLLVVFTLLLLSLATSGEGSRERLGILASLIAAFAALILAVLTSEYVNATQELVRETTALRRVETDPDVVAYLEQERRWTGIVEMVIRNVGRGPAWGVSFPDPPDFLIITDHANPENSPYRLADMALFRGLDCLAPSQEYRFYYTRLRHVLDGSVPEITLRITYHSTETRQRGEVPIDRSFVLDPRVFEHMIRIGPTPEEKVERAIQGLRKELAGISIALERGGQEQHAWHRLWGKVNRWQEHRRKEQAEEMAQALLKGELTIDELTRRSSLGSFFQWVRMKGRHAARGSGLATTEGSRGRRGIAGATRPRYAEPSRGRSSGSSNK